MHIVAEHIIHHAREVPDKIALISGEKRITYARLLNCIQVAIGFLQKSGLKRYDRIILAANSEPEFVYGYFAAHFMGVICVPVDPRTSKERLGYIAEATDATCLFGFESGYISGYDCKPLISFLNSESDAIPQIQVDSRTIADVLFTSGTTGNPKGVVLSHHAISAAAGNINQFIQNTVDDIEVMPLPLSHSFGLGRLRCNMVTGGTIVLIDGFTRPGSIFKALEACRATGLAMVPAGFAVLLRTGGDRLGDFGEQLRYIEIGSSVMPLEHKQKIMQLLPKTHICMHYGLTEASRSAFIDFHRECSHLNSVGKASPGVEIRIVDDKGDECDFNQQGRILISGAHIMSGYWNDSVRTLKAFEGEYLVSGDVGSKDEEGHVYLASRESDIINVGGRKVTPTEIEVILNSHEAVEECVCVGINDPRGISGSAVKAFLVRSKGADEPPKPAVLASYLRGKVETYKMPVAYQWIDRIPRTESGKIKRRDVLTHYHNMQ